MTIGAADTRFDGLTAADLARHLALPCVECRASVDSTQDVAHALAADGAPSGTLVLALEQTAGRGRQGRSWSSRAGAGLWLTMVERPTRDALDVLSLRVGLAVAERLDAIAPRTLIKWPNDLVRPDASGRLRKFGGILVEARWRGDALDWVAIGAGINLVVPDDQPHAISVAADRPPLDVLGCVVGGIRAAAASIGCLTGPELDAFASRDALRGRTIGEPSRGLVEGVDSTGALVVRGATGRELVRSGTVVLAEGG